MSQRLDEKHWRERAEQARVLSATMEHEKARAILLLLAQEYDALADHAKTQTELEQHPTRPP